MPKHPKIRRFEYTPRPRFIVIVTDPKEQEVFEFESPDAASAQFIQTKKAVELGVENYADIEQIILAEVKDVYGVPPKITRDTGYRKGKIPKTHREAAKVALDGYKRVYREILELHPDGVHSENQMRAFFEEVYGRQITDVEYDLMIEIMVGSPDEILLPWVYQAIVELEARMQRSVEEDVEDLED